jgi:hypothetical protein
MTDFQHPAEQGATAEDFIGSRPNGKSAYPMYQYSVFLDKGRDEQLVLRAHTYAELMAGKRHISQLLQQVRENQDDTASDVSQEACDHPQFRVQVVKKESPNKGKQFKVCSQCDKFLGFL